MNISPSPSFIFSSSASKYFSLYFVFQNSPSSVTAAEFKEIILTLDEITIKINFFFFLIVVYVFQYQ